MTEGIFNLSFSSDNENIGNGFASFENGKIRGGNEEFSYHGTYNLGQQSKENTVAFDAKISVQYYKGINLAILGKIAKFPIEISGIFIVDHISANGMVMKFDKSEINLDGFKIDDLPSIDQSQACWMFLNYASELIEDADKLQLTSAFDAYQYGQYVRATNTAYAVINRIINRLSHRNNIEANNLMRKIDILIDKNILPEILKAPLSALANSGEILDKKSKSPEDCAFPLCIMAFNSLDKLVRGIV
jgi:hypothetical protein